MQNVAMASEVYLEPDSTELTPFVLDPVTGKLSCGEQTIALRPKTLAVLSYLMERPRQLVSTAELRTAIWEGIAVSPGVLKNCILELRTALADQHSQPRYIETISRRGYRFIGAITVQSSDPGPQSTVRSLQAPVSSVSSVSYGPTLVGRQTQLAQLADSLAAAVSGSRQCVFIAGEPGSGKTALVEHFLQQATATQPQLQVAYGRCIEQYHGSRIYLAVLDALGRLAFEPGYEHLRTLLVQLAPTCLAQLPGVRQATQQLPDQSGFLPPAQPSPSAERLLGELVETFETLLAERPLILVLEDLQWSDYATLDFLSTLIQRQGPGRLLLLATYRPADVLVSRHPLRALTQEFFIHGICQEFPLGGLPDPAIQDYVIGRFGRVPFLETLSTVLSRQTEGSPLLMSAVLEEWVSHGLLIQKDGTWQLPATEADLLACIPDRTQQLLARQLDRLSPEERHILNVASVVGVEFSAAAVAAGLEQEVHQVEEQCESLAHRHQLLQSSSHRRMPDRRRATRYCFTHKLGREVVYANMPAGWRMLLHRRIGDWEEGVSGRRLAARAEELALHFEYGQETLRAEKYRRQMRSVQLASVRDAQDIRKKRSAPVALLNA